MPYDLVDVIKSIMVTISVILVVLFLGSLPILTAINDVQLLYAEKILLTDYSCAEIRNALLIGERLPQHEEETILGVNKYSTEAMTTHYLVRCITP